MTDELARDLSEVMHQLVEREENMVGFEREVRARYRGELSEQEATQVRQVQADLQTRLAQAEAVAQGHRTENDGRHGRPRSKSSASRHRPRCSSSRRTSSA